jgi:transcriptional regulator with XRE-family HTH domain
LGVFLLSNEQQNRTDRNRQFIDRIELLRSERGISKSEMYKGIGVSAAAFSQWKSGAHSISDKAITRAAEFFGVSKIWLLTGIETEKAAAPEGDGADRLLLDFIHSLPVERVRGLLVALDAPKEVLAALDREEPRR